MSDELKLKFKEIQITEGKKQIKFVFDVKNLNNNTSLSMLCKKAKKELEQIN